MEISKSNNSQRANVTAKKYQKQIDWRRNKVHELLIRGYSQYDISNILHISQPTISRDIDFIRNQTSSPERKDLAHLMYHEQRNSLDGVQEVMKNLGLIIYNPKIEVKEKMKAMNLMMQCYYMRFKLVDTEVLVKDFYNHAKKVKSEEALGIREREISRREKSLERKLEDHLNNQKLTQSEIDQIIEPNVVF